MEKQVVQLEGQLFSLRVRNIWYLTSFSLADIPSWVRLWDKLRNPPDLENHV